MRLDKIEFTTAFQNENGCIQMPLGRHHEASAVEEECMRT